MSNRLLPFLSAAVFGLAALAAPAQAQTTLSTATVGTTGTAAYPPLVFSETLVNFGAQQLKTASAARFIDLYNRGTAAVDISRIAVVEGLLHFSVDESGCPSTLAPQKSCRVSVTFTPQSAGTVVGRLRAELGDGTAVSTAGLTGTSVQGAVSWSASLLNFSNSVIGVKSSPKKAVVTNTGQGTMTIVSLNVLGDPAFSMESSTCSGALAPKASCDVIITSTPPDKLVRTASLELKVQDGAPATSHIQLYLTSMVQKAALTATPTPLVFPTVTAGTSNTMTLTLRSTGNLPVSIAGFGLQGPQAVEYAVTNPSACTGALAPGAACDLLVRVTPSGAGSRTAQLLVKSDLAEPLAPVDLITNAIAGALSVQPASLDFAEVVIGTNRVLTANLKNTGNAPLVVNSLAMAAASANGYSVSGCVGQTLAPGAGCVLKVTFTPNVLGTRGGGIILNHTGLPSTAVLGVTGVGKAPPAPVVNLSPFVCPALTQNGMPFSCTATLSNRGAAAASVGAVSRAGVVFGQPFHNCPAVLSVGAACTVTLPATIAAPGSYTTAVSVTTGAGLLSSAASAVVQAPQATLITRPHPSAMVTSPSVATHVVTNTGAFPVALTLPPTTGNTVFTVVSTSCGSSLSVGASCDITTRCSPLQATAYTGALTLSSGAGVLSQPLTCTGEVSSVAVSPNGPLSKEVGGWSRSGNAYRISNTGSGPVTIQAFLPASTDWSLTPTAGSTSACTVGRVLQAGQYCLVSETLLTGAPGNIFAGVQRVRTSAGDATWNAQLQTLGVSIVETTPVGIVQTGTSAVASYTVTNLAPYALGGMSASVTGAGFALNTAACSSLAAAGTTGASCVVQVRATAGTTAAALSGTLQINGFYPAAINTVAGPAVAAGVQGTRSLAAVVAVPNVTLTFGTYPTLPLGASADTVHTLRNLGQGPVTLMSVPTLSAGAHRIVAASCAYALVLQPGQSCTVTTRFSPVSPAGLSATLTLVSNVGVHSGVVTGMAIQSSDVSVSVDDGQTSIPVNGKTTFQIVVRNGAGGPAKFVLSFGDTTANGATVVARSVPVCTAPASADAPSGCTVAGNQTSFSLPAYGSATLSQTLTAGGSPGYVTMNASVTVSGVQDPNLANNTASNSTAVVSPLADLGVTINSPGYRLGTGATGTIDVVLRNNTAAGATAAPTASGRFDYAPVSLSGGAVMTITGTPSCVSASAGASCSGLTINLPPSGTVVMRVPYSVAGAEGTLRFDAAITLLTGGVVDPVTANNWTTTGALTIEQLLTEKRCMFTSVQTGTFMGCGTISSGTGKCDNGGGVLRGVFSSYNSTAWLWQKLFDGFVPGTGYNGMPTLYLPEANATWKGTGKKVISVVRGNVGYPVLPQVQFWSGSAWFDDYRNAGGQSAQALAFWSGLGPSPGSFYHDITKSPGTLTVISGGAWTFTKEGWPYINYTTAGTGRDGKQYRQIWIENSPGTSCQAPGTTRVQ